MPYPVRFEGPSGPVAPQATPGCDRSRGRSGPRLVAVLVPVFNDGRPVRGAFLGGRLFGGGFLGGGLLGRGRLVLRGLLNGRLLLEGGRRFVRARRLVGGRGLEPARRLVRGRRLVGGRRHERGGCRRGLELGRRRLV